MPAQSLALPWQDGKRLPARIPPGQIAQGKLTGNQGSHPGPQHGSKTGESLDRIDDTVLVREAQRGDRAAFEDLVRRYDQAVLRLAMRLTGSEHEAQDIYQEAFLKAYRNVGSFRFECSFYTWIYRIVTNLCLDHLRRKQVRKEDAGVVVNADGEEFSIIEQTADDRPNANPERDLLRRELGSQIGRALEKLTPRERMVFELKHYHGLKLRTVGEMLNTTEETAKNTLFRATQKLRGALSGVRGDVRGDLRGEARGNDAARRGQAS